MIRSKYIDGLVSIITPSYNSSVYIAETIESALAQTFDNWELLIVDDASTDSSCDVVADYVLRDERIQLLRLEKNVGAAEARNVALEKAKGRYIAFLDSDDKWTPNKLEKQLEYMAQENCAFVFSAYSVISESGQVNYGVIEVPSFIDYEGYLKNTIIGCLTVLIDREKTGAFLMPNIKSSHDMALWLSILKRVDGAHGINEVLGEYRLVSNSNTARKWKAAKDVWSVYRDIESLALLKSAYCFSFYVLNALLKRARLTDPATKRA